MNYSIDQVLVYPTISAVAVSPEFKQEALNLPEVIRGKIYTITFQGFFEDCSGTHMDRHKHFTTQTLSFRSGYGDPGCLTCKKKHQKKAMTLVINEIILFNPVEGCSDFIEISFNRF
ncbi:MAG: hypothetical protein IPH84_03410 [Bacteroidales bacterium]|nr:hypothetical protein [Bacteroidales bacterium]